MSQVRRVDPDEFDWGAPTGVAEALRGVLEVATAEDEAAPLDEAALLRLRHQGLEGSALWVADLDDSAGPDDGARVDGFAWLREEDLDLAVAPGARQKGLGRALATAALAEGGDRELTAWSHGNHPGAMVLARDLGFDRVRDLWVMRRPLTDLPPPEDPGTERVVVRNFRPGEDDDAFLAVNAEAFADHPEQGRMTLADLMQRMAEPWFDPEGFFVATAPDGDVLGYHWTKVHDGDHPVGEVYVVGVSPRAQGLGLGRLLTLTGLHHLASRGLDQVLLFVDADNRAAVTMYTRLGFTHADADTHVQYRRTGS